MEEMSLKLNMPLHKNRGLFPRKNNTEQVVPEEQCIPADNVPDNNDLTTAFPLSSIFFSNK